MLVTGYEQYSLRQVQDLIQVLPVASVLLSPNATILALNQHYADFFAQPLSKILGQNLQDIDYCCYQSYGNDLRILKQGQKLQPFEHIFAGREHRLTFQPYYHTQEGLCAVLVCALDISDLVAQKRQLQQSNQDLLKQLNCDSLTGLASRYAFAQRLEQHNVSVVGIFDLDNFKSLNDHYGHVFADRVLGQLGRVLQAGKQRYAWPEIYRMGGEEFVMLFEQVGLDTACQMIEQIRQEVLCLNEKFALAWGSISLSAGLAQVCEQTTVLQALEHADQAMYRAKQKNKNNICYYQDATFYRYLTP